MIEAIEGTEVIIHAQTNMAAAKATINLAGAPPSEMTVDSTHPKLLTGSFNVQPPGKCTSYTISFRTTGGQLNPSPVTYDILSIADRPPLARFVQPEKPTVKVPANVKVDLVATGTDDHAVKQANLVVAVANEQLFTKDLLEGQQPKPEFKAVETLDLPKLGIKAGSTIQYKLTVWDNKLPGPNKTETALQIIEVVEPVSPAEKKKFEEAQKSQQQPDPTTTGQEQAGDENLQQNPGNPDEPKEKNGQQGGASDGGGNAGKQNETPGNQPDTGTAGGGRENDGGAGGGENQNELTPEQEKKIADAMKQRQNRKSSPSSKDGKPSDADSKPGSDQKHANKTDGSQNADNSNRPQDDANAGPRDAKPKQPGKLQAVARNEPARRPESDGQRRV